MVHRPWPHAAAGSGSRRRLLCARRRLLHHRSNRAETHCGRIWAFEIDGPGKVKRTRGPVPWERGRLVAAPAGYHLFDSLAVDSDGNICVGSLPNAIGVFSADGKAEESIAMPDIFPTNICFGGPDLQTAYITLSASGVLASMQWPRPGLALHFLNR